MHRLRDEGGRWNLQTAQMTAHRMMYGEIDRLDTCTLSVFKDFSNYTLRVSARYKHPMTPLRMLLVEDNADDAILISNAFRRAGVPILCERVDTPGKLVGALLSPTDWDLVMCDCSVPCMDLRCTLALLGDSLPASLIVVLNGGSKVNPTPPVDDEQVDALVNKDYIRDLPGLVWSLLPRRRPIRAIALRDSMRHP